MNKLKDNKLFIQIMKFVVVGGIATIIDFAILFILKEYAGLNEILANTISFTVSLIYNYLASVKWVFEVNEEKSSKKQFIMFIIFSVIGLLINNLIMWIFIDIFSIYYLIGKVIATGVVMVFNFITRKMFLE